MSKKCLTVTIYDSVIKICNVTRPLCVTFLLLQLAALTMIIGMVPMSDSRTLIFLWQVLINTYLKKNDSGQFRNHRITHRCLHVIQHNKHIHKFDFFLTAMHACEN
jgi:hypothetical protein